MTTERQKQILDVLRRSVNPSSVNEHDEDWWFRLYRACLTVEGDEHKGDLLYHEAITYLASVSNNWVGIDHARKAVAVVATHNRDTAPAVDTPPEPSGQST